MSGDVFTSTFYLDHDEKFQHEKPYELRFPPPKGFPARNCTWSNYEKIKVTDVRGREGDFTLDRHGFQLCHLRTALSADDFASNDIVEKKYLKEAAQCLKDVLQADRVLVFDYSIRKSIPGYPISDGQDNQYETPATIVHIDTTEAWTTHMNSIYEEKLGGLAAGSRYQYVNIWKPLRGPVKKWPLMLCDWNTYNPKTDVISRDLVFGDGEVESTIAYYNPDHTYYYLSNQQADEAWIMVQSDSTSGKGVLHTAFSSPLTLPTDPERESIEVRCMVYF